MNTLYVRCTYATNYFKDVRGNNTLEYRVKLIDTKNTVYTCIIQDNTIFRPKRFYKVRYTSMESAIDKWGREYSIPIGIQIVSVIDYKVYRAGDTNTDTEQVVGTEKEHVKET